MLVIDNVAPATRLLEKRRQMIEVRKPVHRLQVVQQRWSELGAVRLFRALCRYKRRSPLRRKSLLGERCVSTASLL